MLNVFQVNNKEKRSFQVSALCHYSCRLEIILKRS